MTARPTATPGAKMQYLIKRRPSTAREELVAHWFSNHMPIVAGAQRAAAEAGRLHARRYVATLFDADRSGDHPWDGVAQLWWDRALPMPDVPHGSTPTDSFQEKAEPYVPWATTEYVVIDPSAHLPVEPLTLNDPFPTTRSGFHKVTFLVGARDGVDHDELCATWLDAHVPNVEGAMRETGGLGYMVSQTIDPDTAPYAGMAELVFRDLDGWKSFVATVGPDAFSDYTDAARTVVLTSHVEMIGIP